MALVKIEAQGVDLYLRSWHLGMFSYWCVCFVLFLHRTSGNLRTAGCVLPNPQAGSSEAVLWDLWPADLQRLSAAGAQGAQVPNPGPCHREMRRNPVSAKDCARNQFAPSRIDKQDLYNPVKGSKAHPDPLESQTSKDRWRLCALGLETLCLNLLSENVSYLMYT